MGDNFEGGDNKTPFRTMPLSGDFDPFLWLLSGDELILDMVPVLKEALEEKSCMEPVELIMDATAAPLPTVMDPTTDCKPSVRRDFWYL